MEPIYTVFSILSALRNGAPPHKIGVTLGGCGLRITPRVPFWLALCRQAGLINDRNPPAVTGYARQWLTRLPDAQIISLLEAWQAAPAHPKNRAARKILLIRLKMDRPLSANDRREISGLRALGLCQAEQLTGFGRAALNLGDFPSPLRAGLWRLDGRRLSLPHLPDWGLAWQLERFLAPCAPLEYLLTPQTLRQASQRGDPQILLQTLEAGLGEPVPPALMAQILGQPVLECREGTVLTFSGTQELLQLRKSNTLRPYLEQILTPRSVLVFPANAPRLLRLLERRGIYARPAQEEPVPAPEALPPPPKWPTEETHAELRRALDYHLRLQTGLSILYTAPNAERPEERRITPLLIEPRDEYTYVIAYCHTRRGQRTFRLDRMELAELQTRKP